MNSGGSPADPSTKPLSRKEKRNAKKLADRIGSDVNYRFRDRNVAPPWGRRGKKSGRVGYITPGQRLSAPTTKLCGLFPMVVGSGAPKHGVPMGIHLINRETVCLDPFKWVAQGTVTNPGMFIIAQPGCGKSAFVKRLITGMAAFGSIPIILGDVKPDYPPVVEALGGQVIRMGRGLDSVNPLDAGPIRRAANRLREAGFEGKASELEAEAVGRRLALLVSLCQVARNGEFVTPGEEIMLAKCISYFDSIGNVEPVVPDILELLRNPSDALIAAAEAKDREEFDRDSKSIRQTLSLMLSGTMQGIFDKKTSKPIDLSAPAIEIDISSLARSGEESLISAAMLAVWAYGFGVVDASMALSEAGLEPPKNYIAVLDELWRALRGAPGLVERADALTRVNRARGMAQIMVTHSLDDLEALPTEEDRKKARGLVERSGTVILGGVSPREAEAISGVVPLSTREKGLLTSWQSPSSWNGLEAHPGRGRFMIKTGDRTGLPIQVLLLPVEIDLYNTDRIAGKDR